jgi:hypothetical protein
MGDSLKTENWYAPESCFITFETDDANEYCGFASEYNEEHHCYKVLDFEFKLCEICSEPTDIIWKNRYLT